MLTYRKTMGKNNSGIQGTPRSGEHRMNRERTPRGRSFFSLTWCVNVGSALPELSIKNKLNVLLFTWDLRIFKCWKLIQIIKKEKKHSGAKFSNWIANWRPMSYIISVSLNPRRANLKQLFFHFLQPSFWDYATLR